MFNQSINNKYNQNTEQWQIINNKTTKMLTWVSESVRVLRSF